MRWLLELRETITIKGRHANCFDLPSRLLTNTTTTAMTITSPLLRKYPAVRILPSKHRTEWRQQLKTFFVCQFSP
jgi:hypothetical protein